MGRVQHKPRQCFPQGRRSDLLCYETTVTPCCHHVHTRLWVPGTWDRLADLHICTHGSQAWHRVGVE